MTSGESKKNPLNNEHALRGIKLAYNELAHQVNNQLGVVMGSLELALGDPSLSPETRGFLEQAMLGTERIGHTVTKFGAIKRIVVTETPMGEAIDLDQSIAPNPPSSNP